MAEVVKMSVAKALAEVKLLEKRIETKMAELTICGVIRAGLKEEAANEIKAHGADLQSIESLTKRRLAIKRAIIVSNASTVVKIGAEDMTVAEAIERKKSIQLEMALEKRLRETYYGNKTAFEKHMAKVNADAAAHTEKVITSQGLKAEDGKPLTMASDLYKTIYDSYVKSNEVHFVAIEGVEDKIKKLRDDIDAFDVDVDNALVESNVTTQIEVTV